MSRSPQTADHPQGRQRLLGASEVPGTARLNALSERLDRFLSDLDGSSTTLRIVLAVSGGGDSLALLLAAARLRARKPRFQFHVATMDHGLRRESAGECGYVLALSERFGLPARSLRWDGNETLRGNLLAAARDARYERLTQFARELGACAVLTAHHEDDQCETALMALKRERSPAGMRAIRDLWPGIILGRPFLEVPGAFLKSAVQEAGIAAIEDPSNADPRFERVRVRSHVADPGFDRVEARGMLARASADRARLDGELSQAVQRLEGAGLLQFRRDGTVSIVISSLRDLERHHRRALLSRMVLAAAGRGTAPSGAAVARLDERLFPVAKPQDGHNFREAATLAGALLRWSGVRLVASREYGRSGPQPAPARDFLTVFDGRFAVRDAGCDHPGSLVVPLAHLGRGNWIERTLPVLMRNDQLLAAHPDVRGKVPAGIPNLSCTSLVRWRFVHDLDTKSLEEFRQVP